MQRVRLHALLIDMYKDTQLRRLARRVLPPSGYADLPGLTASLSALADELVDLVAQHYPDATLLLDAMIVDRPHRAAEIRALLPSPTIPPSGGGSNYREVVSYDELRVLCLRHGSGLLVGFSGGIRALRARSADPALVRRRFKVDYGNDLRGEKIVKNWLTGDVVADVLGWLPTA